MKELLKRLLSAFSDQPKATKVLVSIDGMSGAELPNDPPLRRASYRAKPDVVFELEGAINEDGKIYWVVRLPDGSRIKLNDKFFKKCMERI